MNSVAGTPTTLDQIRVSGIRGVTADMISEAKAQGLVYRLVATAKSRGGGGFEMSVEPVAVPEHSFIGGISGWEMGVVFVTDLFETTSFKIDETSVIPTSAAVLRDIVHFSQAEHARRELKACAWAACEEQHATLVAGCVEVASQVDKSSECEVSDVKD